jgi:hypothetical protein
MPVGSAERIVALKDDAKFSLFRKMTLFGVEEPDKVITRYFLLAIPDDAQQNVVKNGGELRLQEIETGENRDTIPVSFPHIERFAFEKLPTVDKVGLANENELDAAMIAQLSRLRRTWTD